jgi:hypothetical protein
MANKVIVGETVGGPAEVQAAINLALAGVTPVSVVTIALDGGLHMSRWIINYQDGSSGSAAAPTVANQYLTDLTVNSGASSAGSTPISIPTGVKTVKVQLYCTGNASTAGGTATAYISLSLDGTKYATSGIPVAVTIAAGALVSNPVEIVVSSVKKMKVLKITNTDAGYSITAANVIFSYGGD